MPMYRLRLAAFLAMLLLGLLAGCGGGGNDGGPISSSYTLTLSVSPPSAGAVTPTVGSIPYTPGYTANLGATPAAGFVFSHWGGSHGAEVNSATNSLTMNGNKEIIAVFAPTASAGMTIKTVPDSSVATSLGALTGKKVYFSPTVMNGVEGRIFSSYTPTTVTVTATTNRAAQQAPPSSVRSAARSSLASSRLNPLQMRVDGAMRAREQQLLQQRPPQAQTVTTRQAITEGTVLSFLVEYSAWGRTTRAATCRKVGEYCYIFVDNSSLSDAILTNQAITNLAQFFDTIAYPTVRNLFGADTDTDGDPRLFILCTPLERDSYSYTAGYFSPADKHNVAYSNKRDMFYLTVPKNSGELAFLRGTLAHEFQHMVNYDRRVANNALSEQDWLNEGLSELAGFLCIGEDSTNSLEYLAGDTTSLTLWDYNNSYNTLKNYAGSWLFVTYLYDRFQLRGGDAQFLKKLVNSNSAGINNVRNVTGISFNALFLDWQMAMLLSHTAYTTDPRFHYLSINLRSGGYTGFSPWPWNVSFPKSQGELLLPYTPQLWEIKSIGPTTGLSLTGEQASGLLFAF